MKSARSLPNRCWFSLFPTALLLQLLVCPEMAAGARLESEKSFEKAIRSARGVSPDKRSYRNGRTELMGLAANKYLSPEEKETVARRIVERGASLGLIDDAGNTVLHLAVAARAPALARYLIEKGADRDFPNLAGDTPFQLAMRSRDPVMIGYFLDNARIIDNRNIAGHSALFEAAEAGDLAIVKRLIALGADPGSTEKTALLGAVIARQKSVVQFLIEEARLPVDGRSENGETPLMGAAAVGDLAMTRYLVEGHRADVNALSEAGGTALKFAALGGHQELVQYLVEQKADPEKSTPTALGAAAQHGQLAVMEWLVAHGAKLGPGTPESPGALYWALVGGSFEAARALLAHRAPFPVLPSDTPPLLRAEIHREYARSRVAAGDLPSAVPHLSQAADELEKVTRELNEKSREANKKANLELALRFGLTVLAVAAQVGASHVRSAQHRTLAEIAALRHSANRGTGLSGYYAYMSAFNRTVVTAPTPELTDSVAIGFAQSGHRDRARAFEAQAKQFTEQAKQLRAAGDCLRALAPGADSAGCTGVPFSDAESRPAVP